MIRDFGNCGNWNKVKRIQQALDSAKENECGVVFVLPKLCYANNTIKVKAEDFPACTFAFTKYDLLIFHKGEQIATCPWWDIVTVQVIW